MNATDLDGVGAVTKVEIHSGTSWHITLATDASACDKLLSDTGYTINVEYTYDLNDGQGTQTLTQRVDYYTAPIFDFVRATCANTSAVSVGEVIYFEAIVDNPSDVVVSKVKINGNYYDVAPATTANSVIVDMTVDDGFEGGNTDLTMTEIVGTLHGQEMTLDVQTTENTAMVFVNGELTVKSITIVDEDGNPCDYVVNGQTYYYLVEFNNKTGYNIDAVTIERRNFWEYEKWYFNSRFNTIRFDKNQLMVIDNECVKIAFIVDDYTTDNSGGRNFSYVTKVEYSNELLGDKQKDAGRICSPLFANGVSGDVVEIKTASDLRNMSKSAHYVLINDIDLSGTEWSNPGIFNGMFDGQGHTISGINFVGTVENCDFYWGLFSMANGTVCNLNSEGRLIATITSTNAIKYGACAGGLCGRTNLLTVDNVKSRVDLTVIDGGGLSSSFIGGIFGSGWIDGEYTTTIMNCDNYGNVNGMTCGGIVGNVRGLTNITNCTNYGNVSGLRVCGGIVGSTNSKGQILKSNNYGNVMAKEDYAGGIAGSSYIPISQCFNAGEIHGQTWVGGIAGHAGNGGIYNCGNVGNVFSTRQQVGGITGCLNINMLVENCFNVGKIQGSTNGGGIAGNCYNGVVIRNCYTDADIECGDGCGKAIIPYSYNVEILVDNSYYVQGYDDYGTQKTLPEIIEIMRKMWDNEIWDFDNLDQYGNPTLRALQGTNE